MDLMKFGTAPMNEARITFSFLENGEQAESGEENLLRFWKEYTFASLESQRQFIKGSIKENAIDVCVPFGPVTLSSLLKEIRPVVGWDGDTEEPLRGGYSCGDVYDPYCFFTEDAAKSAGANIALRAIGICRKCQSLLFPSLIEGYTSQCFHCDEDFYGIEQLTPYLERYVFVYHEHNDADAYGEQLIRVFENEDDGKAFLRERVEEVYDMTWDEVVAEVAAGKDSMDTVRDNYVSINTGNGVNFFVLDKKEVETL